MAALTGLGHRLGLDQQEAVRAVQLGVLTLNHSIDRNWSRSVLILVFILVFILITILIPIFIIICTPIVIIIYIPICIIIFVIR